MADRESPRPSVDDAIDGAVRRMMDVDARPGFERRVRHRLAQPRVATSPAVFRVATAAAVLATIVVSVFLLRDTSERTPRTTNAGRRTSADTPAPARQQPIVPTLTQQKPSTGARDIRERPAPRPTRGRTVVAAASTEAAVDDARAITTVAALEAPAALAVGTLEQRPVTIADIRLAQLEIRGLHVEPLPATDGSGKE